jgi:hypothetical protein
MVGRGFEVQGPHQQPNTSRGVIRMTYTLGVKVDFASCSRICARQPPRCFLWISRTNDVTTVKHVAGSVPRHRIATRSGIPLLTMFRTAVRRKACRNMPDNPPSDVRLTPLPAPPALLTAASAPPADVPPEPEGVFHSHKPAVAIDSASQLLVAPRVDCALAQTFATYAVSPAGSILAMLLPAIGAGPLH